MRKLLLIPVLLFAVSCSEEKADQPASGNTTNTTAPDTIPRTTVTTTSEPEAGSPEAMAKQVCERVIANDHEGLMSLIITQDEMADVIKNSSVTKAGKEAAVDNRLTGIGQMRIDITNGLLEVRKQCEANGMVWENCTYKDARYEVNNPTGYNMMQLHCILDCNGMEYIFTVTDVVDSKNGWKLGGTMYYGEQPGH